MYVSGMLKQFCRSKFLIFDNWRDRKKKKNKGTSIFWLLVVGMHNRSTICPCVYQVSPLKALQKSVIKKLMFWYLRERKFKK